MISERTAVRSRTLLPGLIHIPGTDIRIECLVRDLSLGGARIAISDEVTLPDHFRLTIPKLGREHRVEMRWRRDGTIGAAFADEPAAAEAAPSEARPGTDQRNLLAENRRLRHLLAAIKADPSQAGAILMRENL